MLDNRTGKTYEIPIDQDTVKATDFKQITTSSADTEGLRYALICLFKRHLNSHTIVAYTIQPIKIRQLLAPKSPTLMATRASSLIAAIRSLRWPLLHHFLKLLTCSFMVTCPTKLSLICGRQKWCGIRLCTRAWQNWWERSIMMRIRWECLLLVLRPCRLFILKQIRLYR